MFRRELRDLAHVPRWSVARVIRRQYLPEHSYFVTMYALEIADLIGWAEMPKGFSAHAGSYPWRARHDLMRYCLTHDIPEVWTGDSPGPSKKYYGPAPDLKEVIGTKMAQIFPEHHDSWVIGQLGQEDLETLDIDILAIAKAADMLDALFYLAGEVQMGNQSLGNFNSPSDTTFGDVINKTYEAWLKLPSEKGNLETLWRERVMSALSFEQTGKSEILL